MTIRDDLYELLNALLEVDQAMNPIAPEGVGDYVVEPNPPPALPPTGVPQPVDQTRRSQGREYPVVPLHAGRSARRRELPAPGRREGRTDQAGAVISANAALQPARVTTLAPSVATQLAAMVDPNEAGLVSAVGSSSTSDGRVLPATRVASPGSGASARQQEPERAGSVVEHPPLQSLPTPRVDGGAEHAESAHSAQVTARALVEPTVRTRLAGNLMRQQSAVAVEPTSQDARVGAGAHPPAAANPHGRDRPAANTEERDTHIEAVLAGSTSGTAERLMAPPRQGRVRSRGAPHQSAEAELPSTRIRAQRALPKRTHASPAAPTRSVMPRRQALAQRVQGAARPGATGSDVVQWTSRLPAPEVSPRPVQGVRRPSLPDGSPRVPVAPSTRSQHQSRTQRSVRGVVDLRVSPGSRLHGGMPDASERDSKQAHAREAGAPEDEFEYVRVVEPHRPQELLYRGRRVTGLARRQTQAIRRALVARFLDRVVRRHL